jgi:hypothetical protein
VQRLPSREASIELSEESSQNSMSPHTLEHAKEFILGNERMSRIERDEYLTLIDNLNLQIESQPEIA